MRCLCGHDRDDHFGGFAGCEYAECLCDGFDEDLATAKSDADLRAENALLRRQLIGITTSVIAGCSGVTITSAPGRAPRDAHGREMPSRVVHRCLLERRLQDALAAATREGA